MKQVREIRRRFFASLWGLLAGFAVAACGLLVVIAQIERDLDGRNVNTTQLTTEMMLEGRGLLARLARQFRPDCSNEVLQELRRLAFGSRYVGNIGIHDPTGAKLCSTLDGGPAENDNFPDEREVAPDGQVYTTSYSVPVEMGGATTTTLRVRQGVFSVYFYPAAFESLRLSGADSIRRVAQEHGAITVYERQGVSEAVRLYLTQSGSFLPGFRFDWEHGLFGHARSIPGS